ncbi:hypothetical protein JOB18_047363 [Solea senegalensis]|uniref:Uncharacterized protein n=1 Tax=Solea senegalensis TaxID=28829 RepID=A0AAV6SAS9_SOLSE|nr:hypothetical protein JOB18_047363 [Solea senegalensis]
MLDPTYVAACFRCPCTPVLLSSGLSHCLCPACSPHGPGSPPVLSRCSSRLCHTEAEVRVAVRQEAAEKRDARGFFTQVFTRLTGAPSTGPGFSGERLLTCATSHQLHRAHGSGLMHSFKGRVGGAARAGDTLDSPLRMVYNPLYTHTHKGSV